jgi:hypothetical protein
MKTSIFLSLIASSSLAMVSIFLTWHGEWRPLAFPYMFTIGYNLFLVTRLEFWPSIAPGYWLTLGVAIQFAYHILAAVVSLIFAPAILLVPITFGAPFGQSKKIVALFTAVICIGQIGQCVALYHVLKSMCVDSFAEDVECGPIHLPPGISTLEPAYYDPPPPYTPQAQVSDSLRVI